MNVSRVVLSKRTLLNKKLGCAFIYTQQKFPNRMDKKCQKESSILYLISCVHNIIMKKVVFFLRYEVGDEVYRKKCDSTLDQQ